MKNFFIKFFLLFLVFIDSANAYVAGGFNISTLPTSESIANSDYIPFAVNPSGTQYKITYSDFISGASTSLTLTNSHIFVGNASNVATDIAMSGDATIANTGALTLATVNSNTGSFGSSTSIPSLTLNAKGQVTAASGNPVIAPAGTLTGTTLAANIVSSSLTSLGTIATGVWQGTKIGLLYGGTNSDLSATGGPSQVLQQTSAGAAISVGQLAASDLSNGTAGSGAVVLAIPIVSAKTSNYTVLTSDTGIFTNTGSVAEVDLTLPASPNLGETHSACITTAQILKIIANTSQTINIGGNISASAGYIESNNVGNCISLVYANTDQWYAISAVGTVAWNIDQ